MLVSTVFPDPRVRCRLAKIAVGLAAECDRPEPAVEALFRRHMPGARMLPFVAFLTADGTYVSGFWGGSSVDGFLRHLCKAEACAATCRPTRRPAPCEAPASVARPTAPPPADLGPLPAPAAAAQPEPPPPATVARRTPAATPRVAPRPATRPAQPVSRYPRARLVGDPDATSFDTGGAGGADGCAPPPQRARTGPLPPPRIQVSPPVPLARSAPGARRSTARRATPRPSPASSGGSAAVSLAHRRAREAAERGAWETVLSLARQHDGDAVLHALAVRAHEWAHAELDEAVTAMDEGRYEDALTAVEGVLVHMRGEPEAVDAHRGLGAIRTLLELRYLSPDGEVARTVRQTALDELRGTRWARLFG